MAANIEAIESKLFQENMKPTTLLNKDTPNRIKVMGVGGGGCNAVGYMASLNIENVDFIVCNTDKQSLDKSPVKSKIQLGEGRGAGMNDEVGRKVANEKRDFIKEIITQGDTDMLFVTSGLGGGTGTGAAPIIAGIAKEANILTVGVVTTPFEFEGEDRIEKAQAGVKEMYDNCDTVLEIMNERLMEMYEDMSYSSAFAIADDVLANAVKSIVEIVTKPGIINADQNDVNTILRDSKNAIMSYAIVDGDERALTAVKQALTSPLLAKQDISGAKYVLATVATSTGNELKIKEAKIITDFINGEIAKKTGRKARMFKLGNLIDDSLENKIRLTIIAAGFGQSETPVTPPVEEVIPSGVEQPVETVVDSLEGVKDEEVLVTEDTPTEQPEEIVEVVIPEKPQTQRWYSDDFKNRTTKMIDGFACRKPQEGDLEVPSYKRFETTLIAIDSLQKGSWEVEEVFI
jgi:cell division protein FtsZ